MALIACKICGKEVSDKAQQCPHCGALLLNETAESKEPTMLVCEECGIQIDGDIQSCPNCGCPINQRKIKADSFQSGENFEIASADTPKANRHVKTVIVIVAILAALVIGLVYNINRANKQKSERENYATNLNLATFAMISGAADAESIANTVRSVWHNSIYEERDAETDKYTRPNGYFLDDFNTALSNLFSDSGFIKKCETVKENQTTVLEYMKSLKNPPSEYREAYDELKICYDAYLQFTNLAIDPIGSLQTFSESINDSETAFLKSYNKMEMYLEN